MNDPSKGWPTLDNLEQKHVFLDDILIRKVEDMLHEHKHCLIRGAEGRGKTVIARIVAYNKYKEKWKIRFIDISRIKEEHVDYVCMQVKQAESERTLFIFENSNASSDKITSFLSDFTIRECPNSYFIFTSRKIFPAKEEFFIENPFEKWEENGWYVDINPDFQTSYGIINNFISTNNISYSLTKQDESWINEKIGIETEQIGVANLRRLRWYLETWKEKGGNLCDVEKGQVLEKILKDIVNQCDPELQKTLLDISGVFQFDVNFYGYDYDRNILTNLTKTGIVSALPGYYYRLQHSTDAAHIIEAEATLRENNDADIVTTKILKKYFRSKPENYHDLLKALYDNKKKNIKSEIFEDEEVYKAIFDKILHDHIDIVILHIYDLNLIFPKNKALEFWFDYKKLFGNSPEEQKEKLRFELTKTNLYGINFLLNILNKTNIEEKNWLLKDVLDDDILIEKVKSSSFSGIRNLFRFLPKEKLQKIIPTINPDVLAEKATKMQTTNAQALMWMIRDISNNFNERFTYSYVLTLYKKGRLINLLKNSDFRIILGFLELIKGINLDLYKEIKSKISPYWLQILLSSNLTIIERQIGDLCFKESRWLFGSPKESLQMIVKNLALSDLSEPIKNLYVRNSKPLKTLGRLLSHLIAVETDKGALERIALQIVNNVELKNQNTYTIKELSLLSLNVKICSESAWVILCKKIVSDANLLGQIRIPIEGKLSLLVWHIYQYNEEIGQELADKIFSLDINRIFDSLEPKKVKRFYYDMLKINESKTKSWIRGLGKDKLVALNLP